MVCGYHLSHDTFSVLIIDACPQIICGSLLVVSPSLLYIEMRSTDHLWILSVCFSVLIKVFLSTFTDHLWILTKKTPQMKSICDKKFGPSQMDFICDEISCNKDGKSSQTRSTDHLWILSVCTIRKSFTKVLCYGRSPM